MRRKFLYFKIFDLKEHPKEVEILSSLEVSNIVGNVTPIDNIFQLTQQPEVKRIIENDLNLQNALTDSLPRRGRHGYLWVGDVLPDIVNALSRLSYIKEIFLFQQLLEPEPDFLKQKKKNMTFLEYNIHLWRVYKFWTFSYFLNRGRYIAMLCKSQTEVDEKFKTFRDELHLNSVKIAETDPGDLLSFVGDENPLSYNVDQRSSSKLVHEKKYLTALINSIPNNDGSYILNSFSDNGTIIKEISLFGYNVYGQEINPADRIFAHINGSLSTIDLVEFNRLIPEVQSKLKLLMTASSASQTDLFLYSVEGQFLIFWENEKKRIKGLELPESIALIGKFIAAIRFLVETKSITKSEIFNQIFLATLINLISQLGRKKETIDFYSEYQNCLYGFYLKLYSFNKIKSFYNQDYGQVKIKDENCLESFDNSGGIYGVIAKIPQHPAKKGFEKDRHALAVLNMHAAVDKLEHQQIGNRYIPARDRDEALEEIKTHSGFYEKLPKDAHDLLARLELMGRQDDVLRYFILWKQHLQYIKNVYDAVNENGQVIFILEEDKTRMDKIETDIPAAKILSGLIEVNKICFKFIESIIKSTHPGRPSERTVLSILIFEKIS
jgi:hypothetical protein